MSGYDKREDNDSVPNEYFAQSTVRFPILILFRIRKLKSPNALFVGARKLIDKYL